MKKTIKQSSIIAVMLLIVFTMTGCSKPAGGGGDGGYETGSENGFDYMVDDGDATVTITGYNGTEVDVSIPAKLNNKPVTSIGDGAFSSTSLTGVTIPDSVTSIGGAAFYDTSLTSVTIPAGVTSIGGWAFENCKSLTTIHVDAANTAYSSQDGVLYNNAKTTLITYPAGKTGAFTIPDSVTSIEERAFYGCTSLTGVTIPASVTSIGGWAFKSCKSLTTIHVDAANTAYSSQDGVLYNNAKTTLITYPAGKTDKFTIPDSVTLIGRAVFFDTGLTSVTIPNSVTSIGGMAFYNCTRLASIKIPNSVTSIGDEAFYNCTSLADITIPASVTRIGDEAFYNCTSLAGITIPNSVTSIGDQAFWDCDSLTSVAIPDSVTSIGVGAFAECTGLTGVTISNSVTRIEKGAFYNCTSLTGVTIPAGVTSIGEFAFDGCASLTSVTFLGTIPSSSFDVDAFSGMGDLRTKYLAGGIGTYTRPSGGSTWTKQ